MQQNGTAFPRPHMCIENLVKAQMIEGREGPIGASASTQVLRHLVFVGEDELLRLAPSVGLILRPGDEHEATSHSPVLTQAVCKL